MNMLSVCWNNIWVALINISFELIYVNIISSKEIKITSQWVPIIPKTHRVQSFLRFAIEKTCYRTNVATLLSQLLTYSTQKPIIGLNQVATYVQFDIQYVTSILYAPTFQWTYTWWSEWSRLWLVSESIKAAHWTTSSLITFTSLRSSRQVSVDSIWSLILIKYNPILPFGWSEHKYLRVMKHANL